MRYLRWLATFTLVAGLFVLAVSAWGATGTFAATFVQTRTLPGFATPLVSHGVMRIDGGRNFRWEITKPYHYVFQMHEGAASEELPDGTVRKLDPAQTPWLEAVERIFVSALQGDREDLKHYFTMTIVPATEGPGRHVTLVPLGGAMAQVITRIDVTEAAPGHPEHLQIAEASGGHMDIRFTPIASNRP